MKNLLIRLGLWEEKVLDVSVMQEALNRYCQWCKLGFKKPGYKQAHDRIVHLGVLKKNA